MSSCLMRCGATGFQHLVNVKGVLIISGNADRLVIVARDAHIRRNRPQASSSQLVDSVGAFLSLNVLHYLGKSASGTVT